MCGEKEKERERHRRTRGFLQAGGDQITRGLFEAKQAEEEESILPPMPSGAGIERRSKEKMDRSLEDRRRPNSLRACFGCLHAGGVYRQTDGPCRVRRVFPSSPILLRLKTRERGKAEKTK